MDTIPEVLACPRCHEHDINKLVVRPDWSIDCLTCRAIYRLTVNDNVVKASVV